MVLFSNCKINLGLNITEKRADGYHNIETAFYPVQWHDAIEIIQASDSTEAPYFTATGLAIPGKKSDNICLKAYMVLKKDFPELPSVKMHLHKSVPVGAGLGGGSANGAFTLQLINKKLNLGLSSEQLVDYAFQLGSDCPFFIINRPCFATGRGEKMDIISLDLSGYSFLIIYPGIHVNSGLAFSKLKPQKPVKSIRDIILQPVETWKKELVNDFEPPIFAQYPEIANAKEILYKGGALYASLTGSGSAVFGIFPKNNLPELNWEEKYIQKSIP
ncbi:MAG TPA: 4-(cytidine 5'-diphospho)-2-C-methyl-D-erythritol kinase [Agriterribacter sp.]|nr:4-(cytidine 5'-diphospho)-2-C-methyl-D-erythritol kinase [Agriterribacter sp.]